MTTETRRLELVCWHVLDEGRLEDGRWCVLAKSCEHFIISFADTRSEAWMVFVSMVMKLTEEGHCVCRRL